MRHIIYDVKRVTCNTQACIVRLAGEGERVMMRNKDLPELNGDVFLQQRDEAAAVAHSALTDIVAKKGREGGGRLFRMMQVTAT